MGLLIGTDEAGYGPNLGPLVVAATIWRTSEGADGVRLRAGPRSHGGIRRHDLISDKYWKVETHPRWATVRRLVPDNGAP